MSSAAALPIVELLVPLPVTQVRLCARIWNAEASTSAPPPQPRAHDTHFVLIHGWLDNAASWDPLIPLISRLYATSALARTRTESAPRGSSPSRLVCYCLEMSGHGNSDHRSLGATYHPAEHALDMIQAIKQLRIPDRFFLMGHSMGGAVAYILASAFGNRLSGLVLMDSIGPWVPPTWMSHLEDPSILRLATALQEHILSGPKRAPKVYPSREDILARYIGTNPFMEPQSAKLLADRAIKEVYANVKTKQQIPVEQVTANPSLIRDAAEWKKGWVFKHDSRLISSALMTPLEENTLAAFRSITCPVLIFFATNVLRKRVYSTTGRDPRSATHWILPESNPKFAETVRVRIAQFPNECTVKRVEGDHHVHMDSPSIDGIAVDIMTWLERASKIQEFAPITPVPGLKQPVFFTTPTDVRAKL